MVDIKKIEELVESLSKVLPAGTDQVRAEVQENLRTIVESAFSRMNLVTREEFDAQSRLLQRTREKLDELERIVAEMET